MNSITVSRKECASPKLRASRGVSTSTGTVARRVRLTLLSWQGAPCVLLGKWDGSDIVICPHRIEIASLATLAEWGESRAWRMAGVRSFFRTRAAENHGSEERLSLGWSGRRLCARGIRALEAAGGADEPCARLCGGSRRDLEPDHRRGRGGTRGGVGAVARSCVDASPHLERIGLRHERALSRAGHRIRAFTRRQPLAA